LSTDFGSKTSQPNLYIEPVKTIYFLGEVSVILVKAYFFGMS
jgi:hypothetical protein